MLGPFDPDHSGLCWGQILCHWMWLFLVWVYQMRHNVKNNLKTGSGHIYNVVWCLTKQCFVFSNISRLQKISLEPIELLSEKQNGYLWLLHVHVYAPQIHISLVKNYCCPFTYLRNTTLSPLFFETVYREHKFKFLMCGHLQYVFNIWHYTFQ